VSAPAAIVRSPSPPSVEEVYDGHVDFVARFARGLGVPSAEIEDLIQDVFVVVVQQLGAFESRSSVRTWMARITYNIVRTHRRKRGQRQREAEFDDEIEIEGKSPHDIAIEREAMRAFAQIFGRMPEEQRVVFWLAELEGLDMPAIASSVGVPLATAHSRLRLARGVYRRAVDQLRAKDAWRLR
jgi:RNA polymerase sigma-70 factor (ECF subfamily)